MSTPSQRQCLHQYFFNGNQVGFNINFLACTPLFSYRMTSDKPFMPLFPMVETAGNIVMDSVANAKTQPNLMNRIAHGCLTASQNYLNQSLLLNQYESGDYGNYLALKTQGLPLNLVRFNQTNQIAQLFVDSLDALTTQEQLLVKIDGLVSSVKNQSDYRMFLAPGTYYFADGTQPNTDLDTYRGTSVDFKGFYVLELESII